MPSEITPTRMPSSVEALQRADEIGPRRGVACRRHTARQRLPAVDRVDRADGVQGGQAGQLLRRDPALGEPVPGVIALDGESRLPQPLPGGPIQAIDAGRHPYPLPAPPPGLGAVPPRRIRRDGAQPAGDLLLGGVARVGGGPKRGVRGRRSGGGRRHGSGGEGQDGEQAGGGEAHSDEGTLGGTRLVPYLKSRRLTAPSPAGRAWPHGDAPHRDRRRRPLDRPRRPAEYNTITPAFRDELAAAIDEADADRDVHVILLRAEGPAFCAGYGLDWSTVGAGDRRRSRRSARWDSVADLRMMGRFVDVYMKLWYAAKPTIAAVQGWCIGGGTDMVLCADIVIAGEGATLRLPAGARLGHADDGDVGLPDGSREGEALSAHRRRDPAPRRAARIGLILEVVPDAELQEHAIGASRAAWRGSRLNQLVMLKLLCNQTAENMGLTLEPHARHALRRHRAPHPGGPRLRRAARRTSGFRQAVRERDDPFGDYGSRKRD